MTATTPTANSLKPQGGATLVELLLCVGVAMAAGAAVIAMAVSVSDKAKTQDLGRDTAALVAVFEDAVGSRQSYYGLTHRIAINSGLVPEGLNQDGQLGSAFGPVRVSSYGANHDGFRLTFQGIPTNHCADLVMNLAPLAHELRVGQVVVASRGMVNVESLGACEKSTTIELDRWTAGKGLKAPWESWNGPGMPGPGWR